MTNITQNVRDFLGKNPSIIKNLKQDIINVRALALYIIKKENLGTSIHAVMSAIRRYHEEEKKVKESKIDLIYKDSKISTKSRLIMISVKRHFHTIAKFIPDILNNIHVSKGEVLRISQGRESIKFIVDHGKKDAVLSFIPKEEVTGIRENLGEINIHFSEKYGDMPGIVSPVLNELAANNINILEIISSMPEQIIIINQEDISQCHDTLLRFFYGA